MRVTLKFFLVMIKVFYFSLIHRDIPVGIKESDRPNRKGGINDFDGHHNSKLSLHLPVFRRSHGRHQSVEVLLFHFYYVFH